MEHLHETCQRLRDASLARPVWLSLVQWYSDTIQPRPFWLEKPLELFTDRELEYLYSKMAERQSRCPHIDPTKETSTVDTRRLLAECAFASRFLFGARDGSVKYHDLNSHREIFEAVTLVPSQFDQDANTIVLLSVDMDPDSEYMTFNLGIMKWRLPPLDDENVRVEGLRAK